MSLAPLPRTATRTGRCTICRFRIAVGQRIIRWRPREDAHIECAVRHLTRKATS